MVSRKIQIIISIVVILAASYGLMTLFAGMKKDPEKKPPVEAKLHVHTKPVIYSTITPLVMEGGRLGSQKKVDIISEVQGQILKEDIVLKKGQRFQKGDLLAKINDEEASNNLMASKSRFLNTLANALPDLKIDYPSSYKNWLVFYNDVSIYKDLPEIPHFKSDKEKTFLASRNILNEYYTIKSAEIRLKKYQIRAPFNGSFVSVNFEIGSTINPGGRLGTIIQTNHLELEVPVKASDIQWISMGDEVLVSEKNSNEQVKGKIVRISDFVLESTQSVSVFINIYPQNRIKLLEGMYLNAVFSGKPISDVMEIPRNAVFDDNKVFIVSKGKLQKKEIKVHKSDEKTLIFSGLKEGEQIVVEPLIKASSGMSAEIIK